MEKWGFSAADPSTWKNKHRAPTLSALVDTLASDRNPRSHELAAVLQQYAYGLYADLFNHATTVDVSQSQFVVFGMRSLRENVEKSLAPVFAWQVLRLVWNEVVAGGASQPIHLFIDEAWYLLEQPGAAQRLERMARSFRKYNAALHLATQDANRLVASPEARVIAEIGRVKMLFGQESESAVRALGDIFGLSQPEQADLLRVGKGEGLLLLGNDLRLPLYVAVNPLRLGRLSTNREQQQAVARASGRKAQPVL
jgi:type IV secretory pathway VirB4 component